MGRVFQFAIALLWVSAMLPVAHAQTPPAAPGGPRYIVAYVDVRPATGALFDERLYRLLP